MTNFFTLTTPEAHDDSGWSWHVPAGWRQGRGAYGGVVMAAVIRAMEAELNEPLPLRNVSGTLTAPVLTDQEAHLRVEPLREGSNTISMQVYVEQDGELKTHAVGLFGRRRVADGDWNEASIPDDLGDWTEAAESVLQPPLAPEFAQHFEYRVLEGFPFSGTAAHRVAGWARPRDPGPARDPAYLAGCIDAFWPVPLTRETSPRPIATVSFMMEVVGHYDGLNPEAPLFYQATSPAARDGYTAEFRELWGADGRLLALNQQTFCIIR